MDWKSSALSVSSHEGELLESPAGEIPRGAITEIVGPPSSGRTALLYSLLAAISAGDEFSALLDTEDRFDPASAAAAGVRLSQVLWVRCGGNVEHAIKSADMLAQAGGFGLVALDLGDTPEQTMRRVPMPAWFRLRHAVKNTRTAFVVLSRSLQARTCSAVKIELARQSALWRGDEPARLLNGFEVACTHTRNHRERHSKYVVPR